MAAATNETPSASTGTPTIIQPQISIGTSSGKVFAPLKNKSASKLEQWMVQILDRPQQLQLQ